MTGDRTTSNVGVDEIDDVDALEARALEDRAALEALLAACATVAREPHLFAPDEASIDRCERALELVDLSAAAEPEFTTAARRCIAIIASALGRVSLANAAFAHAEQHFERALEALPAQSTGIERAWLLHDLARCLEARHALNRAETRWRECAATIRTIDDPIERDYFESASAERLAAAARARSDDTVARAFEDAADRCDDRAIEREVAANASAERFFGERWIGPSPPRISREADWIGRSQGLVQNPGASESTVGTVECEAIFGASRDDRCACGALAGRSQRGAICDRCGVEVQRAARRRSRFGHIVLQERAIHPTALLSGPHGSMLALALDLSDERVAAVRERVRCVRYLAIDPRGADTLAPDSEELAAFDEGRCDPAFLVGTGDEALIDALDRLNADGAAQEVSLELRALRAHKSADRPEQRLRIERLEARAAVLSQLSAGAALAIDHVPVLSSVRLEELSLRAPVVALYEALIAARTPTDTHTTLAALAEIFRGSTSAATIE
jgi:hypothetical protein